MEEIWIPYLVGATLFVASAEMIGEADKLPDLLEAHRVSVLDTVPTLLSLLPRDVASLRLIILGGEACPPSIASALVPAWPQNLQFLRPDRDDGRRHRRGSPAGRRRSRSGGRSRITPAMWRARISNLLPPGVEGELLIGGPGVAKGYLRRDRLTREKFIANPFNPDSFDANSFGPESPDPFCTGLAMPSRSTRTATSASAAASTTR